MGRFVKALAVAAMLAVTILANGSVASADAGHGKGHRADRAASPAVHADQGVLRLSNITWEE